MSDRRKLIPPFFTVAEAPDLFLWVKDLVRQKGLVAPGEKVLAAVSGGPDSVALLHLLVRLGRELGFSVSGAPTTALLTTGGDWCLWDDTTDKKMGWFYNDGGTIKEVGPRVPAYSGAKARHGWSQNITASTWTTLTWNNEYWDTRTYHDNSTNPTRLTVPRAGRYRFMCNLIVDYSTTSGGWTMWQLLIRLNGSGAIDSSRANTYIPADHAPEDYAGIGMTIELTLSASDYLELRCRQRNDSASTLTVIGGGGDDDSWFSVEEIV